MNKNEIEEMLTKHGVAFTSYLAEKILEIIENERKEAKAEAIEEIRSEVKGLRRNTNAWLEYDDAIDDVGIILEQMGAGK